MRAAAETVGESVGISDAEGVVGVAAVGAADAAALDGRLVGRMLDGPSLGKLSVLGGKLVGAVEGVPLDGPSLGEGLGSDVAAGDGKSVGDGDGISVAGGPRDGNDVGGALRGGLGSADGTDGLSDANIAS